LVPSPTMPRPQATKKKNSRLDIRTLPPAFLAFAWEQLWPRERAKVLAKGPKTVWLFGAGASHHYNLNPWGVPVPLANDFIRAMHALPTSQGFHSHIGPLVSFLENERGIPAEDIPHWSENIETFMTSIEAGINEFRAKGKRRLSREEMARSMSFSMAFNNMSFICANIVNESQNGPLDPVYRELLDFAGPNDVFATFNWDTLLDRAHASTGGWSPNTGYGMSFAAALDGDWREQIAGRVNYKSNWKLLKLHGSVNWLVPHTGVKIDTLEFISIAPRSKRVFLYWQSSLPFATHKNRWRGGYAPTCYGYYPPNLPAGYFPKQHISAPKGHVFVRFTPISVYEALKSPDEHGVPSSPLLITPVKQKAYSSYGSTIESLWRQAGASIQQADRLVVAGYSFPATDTRAVELLKSAVNSPNVKTIEVIAPDAVRIASRLRKSVGSSPKLKPQPMTLAEYVFNVLESKAPEMMIRAAESCPEVRRWLELVFLLQITGINKRVSPESAPA
jgi:hypothetical protein